MIIIINVSPCSIEACKRQGIDHKELLLRSPQQIKDSLKNKQIDNEGLILIYQHYEERRREKVRILLEVKIIQSE